MIGAWVDAQVDRILDAIESCARWFLERPKPRNYWPDDLHGAELRGASVQAAQRSGLQASDSTETTNASEVVAESLYCLNGCDCSCCYGYRDGSCHCFIYPCNCGYEAASHGYSEPVGSAVRDTTSPTAADGVAGEDAPQNQPHQCVCAGCGCDEYLHRLPPGLVGDRRPCIDCPLGCHDYRDCTCDQPVGEYPPLDARLFAVHPIYEQLQNEFHQK